MRAVFACSFSISLFLYGCTPLDHAAAPFPTQPADAALSRHTWSLDNALTPDGAHDLPWLLVRTNNVTPTLQFDDGRLTVQGLCNSLMANYLIEGSNIEIGAVAGTKKLCDPALMEYEHAFSQRLPGVSLWHITHMPDEPAGRPRLTLRFTDGAQWVLTGHSR